MRRKRSKVPNAVSAGHLFSMQAGKCFHCGCELLLTRAKKNRDGSFDTGYTFDYLWPFTGAGAGGLWNKVLACARCNHARAKNRTRPGG